MALALTPTQVLTGKVRFSYLTVFEPKASDLNPELKYSVQLLIRKTDKVTVDKINAAYKAAFDEGVKSKFGGKNPDKKAPLRDGDEKYPGDATYAGMYFLNASCKADRKPAVVGPDGTPLMERTDIFSGCFGRAFINFFSYNIGDKIKGVGCGLNSLQLLEQGEPLGAGASSAAVFTEIPEDDEI